MGLGLLRREYRRVGGVRWMGGVWASGTGGGYSGVVLDSKRVSVLSVVGVPLAAGLGHALLRGLSLPPVSVWWLAILAAWPVVVFAARLERRRDWLDGMLVALGVLPFWLVQQRWVAEVSGAGYVPFAVYLSVYPGLMLVVMRKSLRRWGWMPASIAAPIVWAGFETLRGEIVLTGYPWYLLGQPLVDSVAASASARWVGLYGLSVMIAVLAGAVADLATSRLGDVSERASAARRRTASLLAAGCVLVVFAVAAATLPSVPESKLARVAVVQTNVPQSNKTGWTAEQMVEEYLRLERLTRVAASHGPDLIIWPETMKPGLTLWPADVEAARRAGVVYTVKGSTGGDPEQLPEWAFAESLLELQRTIGVPVLVGEESFEGLRFDRTETGGLLPGYDKRYNSMMLVEGGAVKGSRYNKMRLTPFGEFIPGAWMWPGAARWVTEIAASGMRLDLSGGDELTVFSSEMRGGEGGGRELRSVTPICFEVTVASLVRALVMGEDGSRRADLIINATNDGWFGSVDAGKVHHLQIARWRCIELGMPMVRAANTGISAVIGPTGRRVTGRWIDGEGVDRGEVRSLPPNVEGVLVVDVPEPLEVTVYARVGNVIGPAMLAGLGVMVLGLCAPGRFGRGGRVASGEEK